MTIEAEFVNPEIKETPHCNTDLVVQKMAAIKTLKELREQVVSGMTALPVSEETISAEIENQRQQMEDAIAQCGSLAGIPEETVTELEEPTEMNLEPEITE